MHNPGKYTTVVIGGSVITNTRILIGVFLTTRVHGFCAPFSNAYSDVKSFGEFSVIV